MRKFRTKKDRVVRGGGAYTKAFPKGYFVFVWPVNFIIATNIRCYAAKVMIPGFRIFVPKLPICALFDPTPWDVCGAGWVESYKFGSLEC